MTKATKFFFTFVLALTLASTGADPADKLGHADAVLASLAELPAWHAQRFSTTVRG